MEAALTWIGQWFTSVEVRSCRWGFLEPCTLARTLDVLRWRCVGGWSTRFLQGQGDTWHGAEELASTATEGQGQHQLPPFPLSLFSLLLFLFSRIILLPARPDSKVLDPHDLGSASVTNRIRTPEAPTDFPCYLWLLTFKVFLFFFPVFLFPKDRKQSGPQPADIYLLKALGQQVTAQI